MSYPGTFYGSGHQQVLDSNTCNLIIRQQPLQALVALEGKEKSRKPIDPPPIVQLDVQQQLDPHKHFLVSPYLFMYAILVPADEKQDQNERPPSAQMLGTLCSSLHRLKDTTNNDGGFFIFGDLSVRKLGTHRLRFALYDVSKLAENAAFITDVVSEPFQVVASKDFHGMEESSYLSRAFSDQGVRLRLRKEPRSIASTHRRNLPPKYSPVEAPTTHNVPAPYAQTQRSDHYNDNPRSLKRQRSDDDYGENASAFPPAQMPRLAYPTYGSNMLAHGYGNIKQEPYERMQSNFGDSGHNYSVRSTAYPAPLSGTSGWQTAMQQSGHPTMSTNPAHGNMSEHGPIGGSGSTASIPRPTTNYLGNMSASASYGNYGSGYQSQSSQQYQSQGAQQFPAPPSRTSSDSYPAIYGGLQTPTSMTGTAGLPTGHDTGYMPASSGALSASAGTAGHTPVQNQHYTTDYPHLSSGGYGHSSATYDDSSPTYQTAPQPQSAGQTSYTSTMVSSSLPANNSMLLGQGLPDSFYPQDESSYPTPTHSKPPNQWG